MTTELQGVAFVKEGSPHYLPGRKALFRLTVNPGSTQEAAADAAKGGVVTASTPVTSLTVTFLDTGTSYTPGALASIPVTYGYVQPVYVSTGERVWTAEVPAQGADFDTVHVTAFKTFGTVWEAEVEPRPPADTDLPGTGLLGRYFLNPDLTGLPALEVVEVPYLVITSQATAPPGLPPNPISARWTGRLKAPVAGQYRFRTRVDDGVRLYIDGRLALDFWNGGATRDHLTGYLSLTAGQLLRIWIEWKNAGSVGRFEFAWEYPGQQFVNVPASALYSTDGTEALPPVLSPPEQLRFFCESFNRY